MAGPSLVEFPSVNLADIPGAMRRIADSIEAGEYGDVKLVSAVLVREDLSMATFGWGRGNLLEFAGAFARGILLDEAGFGYSDQEPA